MLLADKKAFCATKKQRRTTAHEHLIFKDYSVSLQIKNGIR